MEIAVYLLNLLSNAIKYSEEQKGIFLSVEIENNLVSIKVKDEGIGIPEEEQKNLFKLIDEKTVKDALEGLFRLLSLVISNFSNELELNSALDTIIKNQRGELYPKKTVFAKDEVKYWRSIPPLPGDSHWTNSDYEIIEALVLKPLNNM